MVRVKRRYIVVETKHKQQDTFRNELFERVGNLYGDFGVACLNRGLTVKRHDVLDGYMVVSVRKGVHEMVMSALPLMQCSIVHLSGTIKGCLKELKCHYINNLRQTIAEQARIESSVE